MGLTNAASPFYLIRLAMFIIASLQVLGGMIRPHTPGPGEEKAPVRKAWEMGHRISGLALLACGFWQMREGIALFAEKYSVSTDNEDKLAIAYWVWIGIMSAAILLGVATKLFSGEEETDIQGGGPTVEERRASVKSEETC